MNAATANIKNLKDICEISAGFPLRGGIDKLPLGKTAMLQMRDIGAEGQIDWTNVSRVTLPPKKKTSFLKPGDIIFSTRGGRNLAVTIDASPFPAVCSPHFFLLQINDTAALSPEFLAWQINSPPVQDYFRREATGTHILNLTRAVVDKAVIAIPDRAVQDKIVALDHLARAERNILKTLVANRERQMMALAQQLIAKKDFKT